jgi:hypothetical protein
LVLDIEKPTNSENNKLNQFSKNIKQIYVLLLAKHPIITEPEPKLEKQIKKENRAGTSL